MNTAGFQAAVARELEQMLERRGVQVPSFPGREETLTRAELSVTAEAAGESWARHVALAIYRALGGAT